MKIQALLLSLIITTGAAMAQGTTYAVGDATSYSVVTKEDIEIRQNAEQQAKCIVELENRIIALEKKVSSLIKIVKMLQARVGTK